MPKNTIEKKLDQILDEIASIKAGLIGRGYLPDDRSDREIYDRARDVVREVGKASTSLLQRKLMIGYAAAVRIMAKLEDEGIIGAGVGAKPRKVLK